VLLVEDNELVRGVLTRMLQSLGHRVCVAADGEEALARAVTYPDIDVLLTDVVMPNMNGPQLAQRLTALRAGLAVIFMSGYAESVVLKKGWLSSGVLLKKPFSAAELESCLRHAVEPRSSKATHARA
jgi:CheY-like chemotaxis protein